MKFSQIIMMTAIVRIASIQRKTDLKSYKNMCRYHDYCHLKMPQAYNKILKFNQKKNVRRFNLLLM